MRTQRSDEQLALAARHLDYEYSMLMAVAQSMGSGIASQGWLVNALLESFVTHFRSLLDFFYPPPNAKGDDVLAMDYFDDPSEWEELRPPISEALSRGKKRAHKEIAHLTYARLDVTAEAKPWPFIDIANEVGNLMELFRRNVPRTRLGAQTEVNQGGA